MRCASISPHTVYPLRVFSRVMHGPTRRWGRVRNISTYRGSSPVGSGGCSKKSRVRVRSFSKFPGQVGSGRVGSGRVGSGRVGSGRVGSGRVGSVVESGWLGSGRVGSYRVRPTQNRHESREVICEKKPCYFGDTPKYTTVTCWCCHRAMCGASMISLHRTKPTVLWYRALLCSNNTSSCPDYHSGL